MSPVTPPTTGEQPPAPGIGALADLRARIDELDRDFLRLLANRFVLTEQIGQVKKHEGLPPTDPAREQVMYERLRSSGAELGLDPDLIEAIYRRLIASVVERHQAIATGSSPTGRSGGSGGAP